MAKVECEIEDTWIEVNGKAVNGVTITCSRCNNCVEVLGEDCGSVRAKAIAKLHATCPEKVRHHYTFPESIIEDRESLRLQNADAD